MTTTAFTDCWQRTVSHTLTGGRPLPPCVCGVWCVQELAAEVVESLPGKQCTLYSKSALSTHSTASTAQHSTARHSRADQPS